jgi:plasmid maintenance system antidote protein VapI
VRRFLLKSNGLSSDTLSRILGVDRAIVRRIVKGTRSLTAGNIKALSDKFPDCRGLSLM